MISRNIVTCYVTILRNMNLRNMILRNTILRSIT